MEATARLGSPIVHLHSEIHKSPWGEFLYAIAKGENYNLKWEKGFGLVVLVAIPPFPYTERAQKNILYGSNIYMTDFKEEDWKHIHFEEVALKKEVNFIFLTLADI